MLPLMLKMYYLITPLISPLTYKAMELRERKHASYEMFNEWVMGAWKHVETGERILDGFCQCGYFDLDWTIAKLHSNCVTQ